MEERYENGAKHAPMTRAPMHSVFFVFVRTSKHGYLRSADAMRLRLAAAEVPDDPSYVVLSQHALHFSLRNPKLPQTTDSVQTRSPADTRGSTSPGQSRCHDNPPGFYVHLVDGRRLNRMRELLDHIVGLVVVPLSCPSFQFLCVYSSHFSFIIINYTKIHQRPNYYSLCMNS